MCRKKKKIEKEKWDLLEMCWKSGFVQVAAHQSTNSVKGGDEPANVGLCVLRECCCY